MSNYFHCAPLPLEPGSIIQPGNFGRMLNCYPLNQNTNAWMLVRELAFENARLNLARERPSRLECAFVIDTIEDAKWYQYTHGRFNIIYEVEALDDVSNSHSTPISLLDALPQEALVLSSWRLRAQEYWSGRGDGPRERLINSRLRIIQPIS
ncbi:DUF2441 domain-containing protein [Herbaspirillum sp. SJZ099]|uniref:DUF2441 domain-containing protein n=1 Tax=Herbaspirillum sp. SJZ099 TaxID=2572916 RepID=UPI00119EEF3C|nr:DUF2441 domain-containing protein [Herbaspirillum sp. SJZ099]